MIHAYGYFLNLPQIFQEYNLRIARSTGVAVTRACSRASAAENPMLTITNRKADQFMRISNIAYSRYENFDLTGMFNKQCFCDSNIPDSHG